MQALLHFFYTICVTVGCGEGVRSTLVFAKGDMLNLKTVLDTGP